MVRMVISMFALRKVYKGPVTLITEGPQFPWFIDEMKKLGADILDIKPIEDVPPLVRKAQLWHYSPYDLTMFVDADTIAFKPIDSYFDKIEEHGFCTGEFAGWGTLQGRIARRIEGFIKAVPQTMIDQAKAYGKATNTGIFGFRKDASILEPWEQLTKEGWLRKCSFIPDEVACQVLLPQHKHWLAGVEWGMSMMHGVQLQDPYIIHYHGRKHVHALPTCAVWKQHFWEYYWQSDAAIRLELENTYLDRKLRWYLAKGVNRNVTIVTAADNRYINQLAANFQSWLKVEGIMEHRIVCFLNGVAANDPRLVPMQKRVEFIPWDLAGAADQRERMLSAYILGAAKHVRTKWWIKVDTDIKPVQTKEYPFGFKLEFDAGSWHSMIAAFRWGYTKPGKWIVALEKWADTIPELAAHKRLFTDEQLKLADQQLRFRHPRISSNICLHRTRFTQAVARMCGARLPVPSHDTVCWYVAARVQGKISRLMLRHLFRP